MKGIKEMEASAGERNGDQTELRLAGLDTKVDMLIWLLAERDQRIERLAVTLAALLAQAYQPTVQQQIVGQLLGVTQAAPANPMMPNPLAQGA
jgi:chlorite dismutase